MTQTDMMTQLAHRIGQELSSAQKPLLISHIRPDGDAVGSLLGLGIALRSIGKDVQMVLSDGVPSRFAFLPESDRIINEPAGEYDAMVVLDASELSRIGLVMNGQRQPDINIDHHVTNLNFAKLNLVDTTAVSTTEIITNYLELWGLPITIEVAEALLTGLVTDTIGFRTANITPEALHTAAKLVEKGGNLNQIYEKTLIDRSFEAVRLWGRGLDSIQRIGSLIWTSLTLDDRQEVGYPGRDDADLVNILSSIRNTRVAIIFIEQPDGEIKVSWRSRPGMDVSRVAVYYGGGGHPAAAGATITGTLSEVQESVLQNTIAILQINDLSENQTDKNEL